MYIITLCTPKLTQCYMSLTSWVNLRGKKWLGGANVYRGKKLSTFLQNFHEGISFLGPCGIPAVGMGGSGGHNLAAKRRSGL